MSNIIEQAKWFAIGAHGDQKRKYTGEPYWYHLHAVAGIVEQAGHCPDMIATAWLHDTVEDTWVTIFDILTHFGTEVARMVSDLTMPNIGNRKLRLEAYNNQLAKSCSKVHTIKYADLIHNTASINKYDPDFAKVYLAEKRELLPLIDKGDKKLLEIVLRQINI